MRLFPIILIFSFLSLAGVRNTPFSDTADTLTFEQKLAGDFQKYYGNTVLREMDSLFLSLWNTRFTTVARDYYTFLYDSIAQTGNKPFPYLKEVTLTASIALDSAGMTASEFEHLLNIGSRVLVNQGTDDFRKFHRAIRQFLYTGNLYSSGSHRVTLKEGSWELKYEKPEDVYGLPIAALPEETEDEDLPETESLDSWGDNADDNGWDSNDDDGWGTQDEWGTSDDGWDSGSSDGWGDNSDDGGGWSTAEDAWSDGWGEESVASEQPGFAEEINSEPVEEQVSLFGTEDITLNGAYIEISQPELVLVSAFDSIVFTSKSGQFYIGHNKMKIQEAEITWKQCGHNLDIEAQLPEFVWDIATRRFSAEKAILSYPIRTDQKVEGFFRYYSQPRQKQQIGDYPAFVSYQSDIPLSYGDDNLKITGGLEINGVKESTKSYYASGTSLHYRKDGRVAIKAEIPRYLVKRDSVLETDAAKVVIYHKRDSIVNQRVKLNFHTGNQELVLLRAAKPFQQSPYTSSLLNSEIEGDMLRWDLNADSLSIQTLNARKRLAVSVTSSNYYNDELIKSLSGFNNFNAFLLLTNHSLKEKTLDFYLDDVVEKTGINKIQLKEVCEYLNEQQFIDFSFSTGKIEILPKMIHYYQSFKNRKDYDRLMITSVTDQEPNAVLNLEENKFRINGVNQFFLSKDPEIFIEPTDGALEMNKGRNFTFSGKISAGNFDYNGRDFRFNYDSFLISMPTIDSLKFKIEKGKTDVRGNPIREELENEFVESSGTLFINDPNNRSGEKKIVKYPIFDASTGAVVYFTSDSYLEGVYDEGLFVVVPPFTLDSVSASEPGSVNFEGTFNSSGMFPNFEVRLQIMEDYSLGFLEMVPSEGLPIYNGKGLFTGPNLEMDYDGLTSTGKIDYLTSRVISDDLLFYQDSLVGHAVITKVEKEVYNNVDFPDLMVLNSKINFRANDDSLYVYNLADPMALYSRSAMLDGKAIITPGGIYGGGILNTRGSEVISESMYFRSNRFAARHARFEIETDNIDKPALFGDDVRLRFDLDANTASISPEIEGKASIEFPYVQYNTSIPEAIWDLESNMVSMSKPEDIAIGNSYFYSTNPDFDSLVFNGTAANYDINTQKLTVTGVPYIVVADALIVPIDNTVRIQENSSIQTFSQARVIIDTLNRYHTLTDAEIKIINRNEFEGQGTYQFVNASLDTFMIQFEEFQLVPDPDSEDQRLHTVSQGEVLPFQDLIISPGMFYKGIVKMYASKPALELDGYVKLDLKTIPDYDSWIRYQSSAEQQEVVFSFEDSRMENGFPLQAGVHFDELNGELYTTFVSDKRQDGDFDFFTPKGLLRYLPERKAYVIEDSLKAIGESFSGEIMSFNENTADIMFEGPLNFLNESEPIELIASGRGTGNFKDAEYTLNTMMVLDFDVQPSVMNYMAYDVLEMVSSFGAPPGNGDITSLLYKVSEIIGDRDTRTFDEMSLEEYTPLVSMSSKLAKSLVFTDVNMKWSEGNNAFYSVGGLGLSNIGRTDINARIDGFMEIKKSIEGDELHIFLQPDPAYWYYFGYLQGRMTIFSSDEEFMEIVASKNNAAKAKPGEFVYQQGDKIEVQQFIDRFRGAYMGIDAPYVLGSPLDLINQAAPQQPIPLPQQSPAEAEDDDGF